MDMRICHGNEMNVKHVEISTASNTIPYKPPYDSVNV